MRKKIFEILDECWFYLRWQILDDFPYWISWKKRDSVPILMWVGVIILGLPIIGGVNLKEFLETRKRKGGV